MNEMQSVVHVVDGDQASRDLITSLAESVQLTVRAYSSAQDFWGGYDPNVSGCLIVDVRLPGASGLELQETLRDKGIPLPVVFVSGYGDIPSAVRAIKNGALDFLEKPFRPQVLLDRIQQAIAKDIRVHQERAEQERLQKRYQSLTTREREIMHHVLAGKSNKVIAFELSLSSKTVEFHRANFMKKLAVETVAQLVFLATRLSLPGENPSSSQGNPH
jgi:two-component system, LuxR family, response regulator FixJ